MVTTQKISARLKSRTPNRTGQASKQYPDATTSVNELRSVIRYLGVSKGKFGRMLGHPYPQNVYAWFSGRVRPSAFWWTRINHLTRLRGLNRLDSQTFNGFTYWDSVGMEDTRVHSGPYSS